MRWLSLVLALVAAFLSQTTQVSGNALDIGAEQIILSPSDALPTSLISEAAWDEFSATTVANSDGSIYEQFAHPAFSEYRLRVARPTLCDPTVKQYSGYLDISDTRHLFFWFFEARTDPESAPLMMWLNGGPGCSSTTGMLFENGPCTIVDPSTTVPNPHSWNNVANMVFLDQPVGTGFSYASDGSKVDTLADLAVDVYAFLQLFVSRFPEYAEKPLHLAAESWGGHYGPNIASAQCKRLRIETPICTKMIEACYRFPSKATCNPATEYCWVRVLAPMALTGLNPYDLRQDCRHKDGLCYVEMNWIKEWMNNPRVKRELGVDNAPAPFVHCNMTTNRAFYAQGQAMRNSAALLPPLVKDGMRLLVFAGDTDGVCNYLGVERWMLKLEHKHHEEFSNAPLLPFLTELGDVGGKVRSAGGPGAGNVTFVQIFDGGHMAPHDQPEATLDMITRWVKNIPFDVIG
ncbi:alpha/beta-hydrolase [Cerioporus squamosus]|nr:alpha/beta-hydrolase [Cerioporus squamosus]